MILFAGGSYLYCRLKSRDKISPNQAVIITGCDSGLGYSLALHCRQLGASVIAGVMRNDGDGARKLKEQDIFVYPLDITKIESVAEFAGSVGTLLMEKKLGKHEGFRVSRVYCMVAPRSYRNQNY